MIIVGSFGAAALKGFGITLLIGLVLSLLSSLLLTRLMLACIRSLTGASDEVAKLYALKRIDANAGGDSSAEEKSRQEQGGDVVVGAPAGEEV